MTRPFSAWAPLSPPPNLRPMDSTSGALGGALTESPMFLTIC
ncbi:hypothetical protein GA0070618_3686 [Micromonospora echinospora]|uniref:Uncharacterized protein n=1 Tax=Micromonospora echinospora TaxID=1877 RepID=A0A1C4Y8E4_MICEC|nr:hypothetical protein GA0070618_3686 [Micromonospora echinospora]